MLRNQRAGSPGWTPAPTRTVLGGCLFAMASIAGCSGSVRQTPAGLEIVVTSEGLSAPADFDDIKLQISQEVDGGGGRRSGTATTWSRRKKRRCRRSSRCSQDRRRRRYSSR